MSDAPSPYYPYSWHQSHDQATVLLMVPYDTREEDMNVIIEQNYLIAGVVGQSPIVKGRLYGNVDISTSGWQLEAHSTRLSARGRTTSTTSTASTHSSYAFVSDLEISSSFAASLESGPTSDTEDFTSFSSRIPSPTLSSGDERLLVSHRRKSRPQSSAASPRALSPGHNIRSMTSSYSSIESSAGSSKSSRLVTLHLEKETSIIWPSLIVGPCPDTLASLTHNSIIFDASHELEHQYNMDPTSLVLVALDLFDIRKDREEAFECFSRAWHIAHVPTATVKLATHYLPLHARLDISRYQTQTQAPQGTPMYYLQCLGGPRGLAQLYLEAGILHLDGAAASLGLMSSSNASLSSLRLPNASEITIGTRDAWNRDREAARRFFDRARALQPDLEVPVLPPSLNTPELEIQMPSLDVDLPVRRRRKKESDSGALLDSRQRHKDDVDNTWLVYLPGLVGAGTAIVVVGVLGALSFSTWSRRNNGS